MVSDRLKTEIETYEREKENLIAKHEGRFAVISGEQILGIWDTYEQALNDGYAKCGLCRVFAIKQINSPEHVHFISREFVAC